MDSATFVKLFKLSPSPTTSVTLRPKPVAGKDNEEEDTFIDLELLSISAASGETAGEDNRKLETPAKFWCHEQKQDLQSFSKRKILPIEPSSKPQSPIQLLKSMAKNRSERKAFPFASKLSRENSTRKNPPESSAPASSSKRFSKYVKLIKPLYEKLVKKYAGDSSSGAGNDTSVESPARCKHLGKSKSASAMAAGMLAAPASNKRDDSLLQQHDWIQAAILHCKRSLNASTEHSMFISSESNPS